MDASTVTSRASCGPSRPRLAKSIVAELQNRDSGHDATQVLSVDAVCVGASVASPDGP